jgi:DNA processing protein
VISGSIRRDFQVTDEEELHSRLVWHALVEPGDRIAGSLRLELGSSEALQKFLSNDTASTELVPSEELVRAYERWRPRYQEGMADGIVKTAASREMQVILPSDPRWPTTLNDLGVFSPALLWYRGNVGDFEKIDKTLGVVGSRVVSSYGQKVTAEIAALAVNEGATVVSGGALGVDAIAHRVTLSQSGSTVAVMAGSLDNLYPAGNWQLFDEIGRQGLLLSEMAPGSKPTRWRFLQRNRLIAALSSAVVVTEAGWRSGSINTVNHANELGRRVFAIPGPITSPTSAGCNRIIRDHSAEILVEVSDLPVEIGWRASILDETEILGSLEKRLLDFMDRRARDLATLAKDSGLSTNEAQIAIGGLKLAGLVEQQGTMGWKRIFTNS